MRTMTYVGYDMNDMWNMIMRVSYVVCKLNYLWTTMYCELWIENYVIMCKLCLTTSQIILSDVHV